jgi:replication fork protection complex subunit Tof1/Swi1
VVKPDNEETRVALFKDNKLRLLMTLVGFSRLGEVHDLDASWIIPSALSPTELQEAIDLIRKFEFDPPTYEDGKTAEDFLRSKAAVAHRSARRAEFDDDSDGIDNDSQEDRGEYALDRPTARKGDGHRMLNPRRRERSPIELDDEEREEKARARRKKELEKQAKIKSTMFVHDSDDEDWDEERDRDFFAREEAIRQMTMSDFKKSLAIEGTGLASSKKRKAGDQSTKQIKRRKTPPKRRAGPFDTDESDADNQEAAFDASSRASSKEAGSDSDSEVEVTGTPLSSYHASTMQVSDDEASVRRTIVASKGEDEEMADVEDDEDDIAPAARRPTVRTRGGFVIDSDSE